jgi:hypothetical protein
MQRNKRDRGGPVNTLGEELSRVTSIGALDRLLRYAKDEASVLKQWAAVDSINTAIASLPDSQTAAASCQTPRKREKRIR